MRLMIIGSNESPVNQAIVMAKKRGARVTLCQDPDSALLDLCSGKGADAVLVDVNFNIGEFLNDLESQHISIPVIGYGINADSAKAAAAIKAGAQEYLPLPPDEVMIAAVLESITEEDDTLISESPAMKEVLVMAERIAPSDANVLITGESGTGKEVVTRFIHQKSKRASQPLISVNCAAIPDNLLESELFGHEKGAFTGATYRRIGKFEEANGGTLLLDEISEMDIRLQAKLLRAIQEQEIVRVGGSQPVKLDLRIVATSNRNLRHEVEQGTFREDLFFRLNVIKLDLPPLRGRREEIIPLAMYFTEKYAKANDIPVPALAPGIDQVLLQHAWPGNVRELENTMHRAVLLSNQGVIDEGAVFLEPSDIEVTEAAAESSVGEAAPQTFTPASAPAAPVPGNLVGRTIESVEQEMVLSTLKHAGGNRTHAAKILGISIRTLRNKLRAYGDAGLDIPS